jgi:hypothetical protein
MKKLYRYRPLSEFLYKELYYQELYFASYPELNDPLDLSARIDFSPRDGHGLGVLIWFLFKATLKVDLKGISKIDVLNNQKLVSFSNDKARVTAFEALICYQLNNLSQKQSFISVADITQIVSQASIGLDFIFDLAEFNTQLKRLTKKFLENSCVACFSETNNNSLMWSHYASKHAGVCLEFTLEHANKFPYKMAHRRGANSAKYRQTISNWNVKETIFWERIRKVTYQVEQPSINFFEFSPVFANEHDADLLGLSKSWTHGYAWELEIAFSTKTAHWAYENEWRAISIKFGEEECPEERLKHYPVECLTAVYFGCKTPDATKKRIHRIFHRELFRDIQYFDCVSISGTQLDFEEWHCEE